MSEGEDKGQGTGGPMEMGMDMAKMMMEQMGKGGPNPMSMMWKMMSEMAEGGQAPPPMMQMYMGMCTEMLTAIKQTTDMAAFATPELHQLYAEWLKTMEEEVLQCLKESGEINQTALSAALKISEESMAYLIARLVSSGKIVAELRLSKSET